MRSRVQRPLTQLIINVRYRISVYKTVINDKALRKSPKQEKHHIIQNPNERVPRHTFYFLYIVEVDCLNSEAIPYKEITEGKSRLICVAVRYNSNRSNMTTKKKCGTAPED
nr:hypothetical protein HmN_000849400 [Hymenolepis microstoma]